jgi:hypothetical protein
MKSHNLQLWTGFFNWPQVAAWVPDMFSNFYFEKNHKIIKKTQQLSKLERKEAQIWNPTYLRNFLCKID